MMDVGMKKNWYFSLDEFFESDGWRWMEIHQDGEDGHVVMFMAETKELAADRLLESIRPLIVEMMRDKRYE